MSSLVPRLHPSLHECGSGNNDIILSSAEVSSYQFLSDRDVLIGWSLAYLDQPSSPSSQNPLSVWQQLLDFQ